MANLRFLKPPRFSKVQALSQNNSAIFSDINLISVKDTTQIF